LKGTKGDDKLESNLTYGVASNGPGIKHFIVIIAFITIFSMTNLKSNFQFIKVFPNNEGRNKMSKTHFSIVEEKLSLEHLQSVSPISGS
jgi:hypothetical protein